MLSLLTLAAGAALAACPAPREVADLDAQLDRAVHRYAVDDRPGFEAAAREAEATLPCIESTLDPELVSRLHLVEGLRRSADGGDARPWLQAAWCGGLRPDRLPAALEEGEVGKALAELKPEGEYARADEDPCFKRVALQPPLSGRITVDGRRSRTSEEMPYVFQRVLAEGRARDSQYVPIGGRPSYVPLRPVLVGVATSSFALAGGALAGAALLRDELHTRSFGANEDLHIETLRVENNALLVSSAAVGLVGVASLVAIGVSFR